MTATTIPERRARLGRYALWQAGDFTMNVAIITVILFGLLGTVTLMNLHNMEEIALMQKRTITDAMKIGSFRDMFAMYAMVAPIIAMSGVISQDRSSGFTRFLFAKPLSPPRFYLQSLLVRFAGYLVVRHILVLAYGMFEPPAYTPRVIVDLAISFAIVGGMTFLFSAVSKYDGLIVIVSLLASSIFWNKWEQVSGIRNAVIKVLPPIDKVGELHKWLVQLSPMGNPAVIPFPTKWAVWLGGYGLACAILGLYLLRRVPLTKA